MAASRVLAAGAAAYIALLDADDCWGPRKLELQMAALEADPVIALIAHRMLARPRGTTVPAPQPPVRVQIIGRRTLLLRNPFPTSSVVLRRDLPLSFDENFRRSEDYTAVVSDRLFRLSLRQDRPGPGHLEPARKRCRRAQRRLRRSPPRPR